MITSLLLSIYIIINRVHIAAFNTKTRAWIHPANSRVINSAIFACSSDILQESSNRRKFINKLMNCAVYGRIMPLVLRPQFVHATEAELDSNVNAQMNLRRKEMELLEKLYQRKPSSYNSNEIQQIEALIDSIISSAQGTLWQRDFLPGIWRVAYIRPGKNGKGLDRRIPFPELPFNESYQKFSKDYVTNVGELLGPTVRVEVSGALSEDDTKVNNIPKRFRADIEGGNLCAWDNCVNLPIRGEGLFDGVYLGEKLRIGQNLNGSGALVVQVRCD